MSCVRDSEKLLESFRLGICQSNPDMEQQENKRAQCRNHADLGRGVR